MRKFDMRKFSGTKLLFGISFLFLLFNNLFAQAQDTKPVTAPASDLHSFYYSYLTLINDSKNPLKSNKSMMIRYVDKELLANLDKKSDLDEDYFTKSQDVLDDWINNITVLTRECSYSICYLQVNLGMPRSSSYKIDVNMKKYHDGWKITKVVRPRSGR